MAELERAHRSPDRDGKQKDGQEQAEEPQPSSNPLDCNRPVRALGFWDVHGDHRQSAGVYGQDRGVDMLQPDRG